jgi:hypothetical protein
MEEACAVTGRVSKNKLELTREDGLDQMNKKKSLKLVVFLAAAVGVSFVIGCAIPTATETPVVVTPVVTPAPIVDSTLPADAAPSVGLYDTVSIAFSEAMDPATITAASFTVSGTSSVAGTVDYDDSNNMAIFTPSAPLSTNQSHTATISTAAKNVIGTPLAANVVWHFTTGSSTDLTAPTVTATVPLNNALGVAVNSNITATFSKSMNSSSIVSSNFTVMRGVTSVSGSVTYDSPNKNAVFNPTANLLANTVYTATVTTGVKDVAGNHLASNMVWSFTTDTVVGLGPAPVSLGTAANFVILAKTGISTVPPSVITGDIGVSPVAESYMTGFSQTNHTGYATSPQVTGFMYAANMAAPTPAKMTAAISDMQTAYTDAAGRTAGVGPNLNLGAGTLNGNTLAPGTYTWGTGVSITGDIWLSGAANDVWIFQVAGTLNESSGKGVILAGAAQAKNIFWQVSGAVTLGTTSHFNGILLGKTGITLQTGATMTGRALAQTLVALQKATLTKPL